MCFTFDIYEGKEAEYKKRHDEIWPELVADIKAAGFKNYTLFRRGLTVVGYFEVDGKVEDVFAKITSSAEGEWHFTSTNIASPLPTMEDWIIHLKLLP